MVSTNRVSRNPATLPCSASTLGEMARQSENCVQPAQGDVALGCKDPLATAWKLSSFHWNEDAALVVRAAPASRMSETTVKWAAVELPTMTLVCPVRRDASGALEFSIEFSALPNRWGRDLVATMSWVVVSRGSQTAFRTPIHAPRFSNFEARRVWRLPRRILDIAGDTSCIEPSFARDGRLTVRTGEPVAAVITNVDASRWRAEGRVTLALRVSRPPELVGSLGDEDTPSLNIRGTGLITGSGEAAQFRATEYESVETDDGGAQELRVVITAGDLRKGAEAYHGKLGVVAMLGNVEVAVLAEVKDAPARSKYPTFKSGAVGYWPGLSRSVFICRESRLNVELRKLRPAERRLNQWRNGLASVVAPSLTPLHRKPVWLIGEDLGRTAQDNGLAFFNYCMETPGNHDVYYVAKKTNRHHDKLTKNASNVVRYDSLRHHILFHRANRLCVAHGIRDVMPSVMHGRINTNHKSVVYLQHGIIAMKKVFYDNRSYNGKIDAFVVSSVQERDIMVEYHGMDPHRICVTGLPRYDVLRPTKPHGSRLLLVMPTWRDWLVGGEDEFSESAFRCAYSQLLRNPNLLALLEEHDLRVKFFPHVKIANRFRHLLDFESERVQLASYANEQIQDLIRTSSMLVTDYSSVAWDFNYLRKPVIFYQFDRREYLEKRGSYIDLGQQLPGAVVDDHDAALAAISAMIRSGFAYDSANDVKSEAFYKYRDKDNCARVYQAIQAL